MTNLFDTRMTPIPHRPLWQRGLATLKQSIQKDPQPEIATGVARPQVDPATPAKTNTRVASIVVAAFDSPVCPAECLLALLASDPLPGHWRIELIVLTPGSDHFIAPLMRRIARMSVERGWVLHLIDLPDGSKQDGLNRGDATAAGDVVVYVESHVRVSPALIRQLIAALDTSDARLACGQHIVPARSRMAAADQRYTARLPILHQDAGLGVFAVNAAGRARWGFFPGILLTTTYVQLQFRPNERITVPAAYHRMDVSSFCSLVRLARRQIEGRKQIAEQFPDLMKSSGASRTWLRRPKVGLIGDLIGLGAHALIALAARSPLYRSRARWAPQPVISPAKR